MGGRSKSQGAMPSRSSKRIHTSSSSSSSSPSTSNPTASPNSQLRLSNSLQSPPVKRGRSSIPSSSLVSSSALSTSSSSLPNALSRFTSSLPIPSFLSFWSDSTVSTQPLNAARINGRTKDFVDKDWANVRRPNESRFPKDVNDPETRSLIARGALCLRCHFDDLTVKCACPVINESKFYRLFVQEKAFDDFMTYKELFYEEVEPKQREVLINRLVFECGSREAFQEKYKGWNHTRVNYPPEYGKVFDEYQWEILLHDFTAKRVPTAVFNLTGEYNINLFARGPWSDAMDFSGAAAIKRVEKIEREEADPTKAEEWAKRKKFVEFKCGADCPCSTGSGEHCACANYKVDERTNTRGYLDEYGTFRMGMGITAVGLDGLPTPLTDIERQLIPIIGCTADCGCGDQCQHKKLTQGCRYADIINVDPEIDLEVRAGEVTPRGEICSVMSGLFVKEEERRFHDAKMFVDKLCLSDESLTFTADVIFYDALDIRRPLAVTRRTLLAGERKGIHYWVGDGTKITFQCKCGADNCPERRRRR